MFSLPAIDYNAALSPLAVTFYAGTPCSVPHCDTRVLVSRVVMPKHIVCHLTSSGDGTNSHTPAGLSRLFPSPCCGFVVPLQCLHVSCFPFKKKKKNARCKTEQTFKCCYYFMCSLKALH